MAFAFWPFTGGLLVGVALLSDNQLTPVGAVIAGVTAPPTLQAMADSVGGPNAGSSEKP